MELVLTWPVLLSTVGIQMATMVSVPSALAILPLAFALASKR